MLQAVYRTDAVSIPQSIRVERIGIQRYPPAPFKPPKYYTMPLIPRYMTFREIFRCTSICSHWSQNTVDPDHDGKTNREILFLYDPEFSSIESLARESIAWSDQGFGSLGDKSPRHHERWVWSHPTTEVRLIRGAHAQIIEVELKSTSPVKKTRGNR